MIQKRMVFRAYQFLKIVAKILSKISLDRGIKQYKQACIYMYQHNVIMLDKSLENQIESLLINHSKVNKINVLSDKILFYEMNPKSNRGLTRIYLKGLAESGFEFVWVTFKSCQTEKETELINIIKSSKNGRLVTLDDTKGSVFLIDSVENLIKQERPKIALLVPAPWDIEIIGQIGIHSEVEKILVNGTDHAFWFGVKFIDKILEFRNYGYNISRQYRNINEDKIMLLPYYPCPTKVNFTGFTFDICDNQRLIVSGGSFYKIYGSDIFFKIIKFILDNYDDTLFYFMANEGNATVFNKFIKDNNFCNRCFYSGPREDFDEVIKRAYLYLNTYPMIGGLMTQYAVYNNVIPIGICTDMDKSNDVDELFLKPNTGLMKRDFDNLRREIILLLENKDYYLKRKESIKDLLISESFFNFELKSVLEGGRTSFKFKKYDVNRSEILQSYLNRGSNVKTIRFILRKTLSSILKK